MNPVLLQREAFASGKHLSEVLQVIAFVLPFPPCLLFLVVNYFGAFSFTRKLDVRIGRHPEARISHQAVPPSPQ